MSILGTIENEALNVARAGLQAATGIVTPGAPAAGAVVATLDGVKITFGQLVTTSKALEGSKLGEGFNKLITDFGDVDNDLDVTEQVAALIAPFIPAAGLIATALFVLKLAYDGGKILFSSNPSFFATSTGPAISGADWSHGFPKAQPVDNPSGAIGGE
jgi:hypothetical protein